MSQQILFPGWNNLSLEQKRIAKKWIKSILRLRVDSQELLDIFSQISNTNTDSLPSPIDSLLKDLKFDVVDSSTTSEGIRIRDIVPQGLTSAREDLREDLCKSGCMLSNNPSPNCVSDCVRNWPPFF